MATNLRNAGICAVIANLYGLTSSLGFIEELTDYSTVKAIQGSVFPRNMSMIYTNTWIIWYVGVFFHALTHETQVV